MNVRADQLADCLLDIEAELRRLGWWESVAPDAAALSSSSPFCIDTLKFEQWLQWVCVPRMKQLLEAGQPLPQRSAIAEMAEVVYMENLAATSQLRRHIKRVDRLLSC